MLFFVTVLSHSVIYNIVVNKSKGEMIMKKLRNTLALRRTHTMDTAMQNHAPIVYRKDRKSIAMHIKAMAIVLVAAFVVSAASAMIVHSLAHSGSTHAKSSNSHAAQMINHQ